MVKWFSVGILPSIMFSPIIDSLNLPLECVWAHVLLQTTYLSFLALKAAAGKLLPTITIPFLSVASKRDELQASRVPMSLILPIVGR